MIELGLPYVHAQSCRIKWLTQAEQAITHNEAFPHLYLYISIIFYAGVSLDRKGFINVDAFQNTNVQNMYALGDVAGKKLLTPGIVHIIRIYMYIYLYIIHQVRS